MEFAQFSLDTLDELKRMLVDSCKESSGPVGDLDISSELSSHKLDISINNPSSASPYYVP